MTNDVASFTISDAELSQVLSEIDGQLRKEGGPIAGREIRGWMLFCEHFNLEGFGWNHPVSRRIFDWFSHQYGDRLNINFDYGNTVAEIRHDLYLIRCVRLYGRELMVCDPLLFNKNLGPKIAVNTTVKFNLLNLLDGATSSFIQSLSVDECDSLVDAYARGFAALSRVEDAAGAVYVREALHDLRQSADQLSGQKANYGSSRFSSLQAVEKLVKSFIQAKNQKPTWGHKLQDNFHLAYSLGLPKAPAAKIDAVQCTGEVRYTSASVGKTEALQAHYAALSLCDHIAIHLTPQSGWKTAVQLVRYKVNGVQRPMKALFLSRGKSTT